jgi:ketosteroid isomerase-like protein
MLPWGIESEEELSVKGEAMKRSGLLLFGLTLCLAVYGVSRAQAKASDEAEIKALEVRLAKAVNARDVSAIMTNYIAGEHLFVFDITPPRQYVGNDEYRKSWEGFLSSISGPFIFEISDLKITTNGSDIAFSHSIQHVAGTSKDGRNIEISARVTDDYRKANGKWLISQEHISVPVNLATGQSDLQSKP